MAELEALLSGVLAQQPHLTARELAWHLRSMGAEVTQRDLNPLLYRSANFQQDGGRVPRWRLASQQASRPDLKTRIAQKREHRRRLDARQQQVTALRSGQAAPPPEDTDPTELSAAIAVLRRFGIEVGDYPAPPATQEQGARIDFPPRPRSRSRQPSPAPTAETPRPSPPRAAPVDLPEWAINRLRPWQREAMTAWYSAGCVGICEAVTGTGKTHLGLEAVAQSVRRGRRATVLVPSVLLQRQWELRLEEFVGAAVIAKVGGAQRGDPTTADVVLAVVNSAVRADLTALGDMELLVADEVHRYGGQSWAGALREGYQRRLGLTATLERAGDDGVAERLLPYFTGVVHRYGYDRATAENVVAPFDLVFLGVDLDEEEQEQYESLSRRLSSARKVLLRSGASPATLHQQLGALRSMGGEVTRAVIAFENATRERRRLLAETPVKHDAVRRLAEFVHESDGTLLFTQSIETASAAAQVLREEEVTAEAISSELHPVRRQQLISDLGDGALQALAAPRILDEGVDVPDVNLGIVMGASSSRRQMIQRLGRIIRLKPNGGRARFIVLYVTGTVEDPQSGARQDFMDEVEDAATRVVLLSDWDEDDLSDVWAGIAPTWNSKSTPQPETLTASSPHSPIQPAAQVVHNLTATASSATARRSCPRRQPARARSAALRPDVVEILEEIEQTRALLKLMRLDADADAQQALT